MKKMGTISLLVALALSGCSASLHRLGGVYPAKSVDHPILMVEKESLLPPGASWIKIGEATVTDNGWGADVTKMLSEKARELGGDALVGFQKYKTTQTFGIGWKDMAHAEVWRKGESSK